MDSLREADGRWTRTGRGWRDVDGTWRLTMRGEGEWGGMAIAKCAEQSGEERNRV